MSTQGGEFGPSSLQQNFAMSFICSSEKSTMMGEFLSTVSDWIKPFPPPIACPAAQTQDQFYMFPCVLI